MWMFQHGSAWGESIHSLQPRVPTRDSCPSIGRERIGTLRDRRLVPLCLRHWLIYRSARKACSNIRSLGPFQHRVLVDVYGVLTKIPACSPLMGALAHAGTE